MPIWFNHLEEHLPSELFIILSHPPAHTEYVRSRLYQLRHCLGSPAVLPHSNSYCSVNVPSTTMSFYFSITLIFIYMKSAFTHSFLKIVSQFIYNVHYFLYSLTYSIDYLNLYIALVMMKDDLIV